jgi:hypothetical protein
VRIRARFRRHPADDQGLPPLDPVVVALKDEKENRLGDRGVEPVGHRDKVVLKPTNT